ncbi:hypothetical protein MBH78_15485 [Oceanimonas sp. NS1]|nr:hypothetical protein [Oceanimonas sp. NS1]
MLLELSDERGCRVLLPDTGEGEQWLPADQLTKSYSGRVIYLKPRFRFDERSPRVLITSMATGSGAPCAALPPSIGTCSSALC